MSADLYDRVKQNPQFHDLVKRRSRFAWLLSAVVLVSYFAFILLIAFAPQILGTPISNGSPITIGIPIGIAIIVLAFVLTGVYVRRANTEFDHITKAIIEEAQQ